MPPLAPTLGNKAAGELIKAKDWNDLVAAFDGLSASLSTFAASTGTRFDALDARLGALESTVEDVAKLENPVIALLDVNRRLEMRTPSASYAFGQLATIEARIGSLQGAPPLDLTRPERRPWVDFFATWGELQPAANTEVRAGGGHRSLSVRVDGNGVARVQLRSEGASALPSASATQVDAILATEVKGKPIHSWILAADTPTADDVKPVFQRLSAEYQRADATHVRDLLDQRFEAEPKDFNLTPIILQPTAPQTWKDERSTIIAILKPDAAPESADASLGVSSLEVRFRDWSRPWFYLDFLPGAAVLETDFKDRFNAHAGTTFETTLENLRKEVNEGVAGLGALGRARAYRAMDGALDKLVAGGAASQPVREASESLQRAIRVEQNVRSAGGGTFLLNSFAASDALSGRKATGVRDGLVGSLKEEVTRARESFRGDVKEQIQAVETKLAFFGEKVANVDTVLGRKADVTLIERLAQRGPG